MRTLIALALLLGALVAPPLALPARTQGTETPAPAPPATPAPSPRPRGCTPPPAPPTS
ncbi:MAG TPA: hypothetical protein VD970_16850 [Acetobacteraceae bacterium]|nr:hypothetical protein [Acetobacteraceae bacterium]